MSLLACLSFCVAYGQDEEKMVFKKRDLIRQLQQGKEEQRAEAAMLLKHNPKAVPHLVKALREDVSDDVRLWAAYSLGKIGNPTVVDHLLELLDIRPERTGGDTVRRNICWALGNLGDRRAVKSLMRELERAEHWEIRYHAARALAKLVAEQALPTLDKAVKSDPYRKPNRNVYPVREQAKSSAFYIREMVKRRAGPGNTP